MAATKTSLSVGEIIHLVLTSDKEVMRLARKVYPIVSPESKLPYVVYRRTQLEQYPVKTRIGADAVGIEILCYTAQYTHGVELAEAVRNALDGKQAELDGLVMRSCTLADSEESWGDDAYVQQLIFNVKI